MANPPIGHVPAPSKPYFSTRDDPRYSFKVLFSRWRGSVYKLVWQNLLVWLVLYYILAAWYRFGMNPEQKRKFEFVCRFCDKYNDLIPLTFVLGFYVNLVIHRWWTMWDLLPWPDNFAFAVNTAFPGHDEKSRIIRRTLVRYVNLAGVHAKCLLSSRVRKRFPTMDHLVEAGLMNEKEHQILEKMMEQKLSKLYFVPLIWSTTLITKAFKDGVISEFQWKTCFDWIIDFRSKLSRSLHIELVNIPLVYSQVVALAVYSFSLSCLLGRQFIKAENYAVDMYIPIFTVLQLVFYWGWLKVAESMIDPYGDDDADFDLNFYIDKNVRLAYTIVDVVMQGDMPELVKDPYFDKDAPDHLPYTDESKEEEARRPRHNTDMTGTYADILPNARALALELERTLSSATGGGGGGGTGVRRRSGVGTGGRKLPASMKELRRRHSQALNMVNRIQLQQQQGQLGDKLPLTPASPVISGAVADAGPFVGQEGARNGLIAGGNSLQLCGIAEEGGIDNPSYASTEDTATLVTSDSLRGGYPQLRPTIVPARSAPVERAVSAPPITTTAVLANEATPGTRAAARSFAVGEQPASRDPQQDQETVREIPVSIYVAPRRPSSDSASGVRIDYPARGIQPSAPTPSSPSLNG